MPRTSPLTKARCLRTNQTPAEAAFWELVRRRRVDGWKFTRQHVIAHDGEHTAGRNYIVDFYLPEIRLCVEIDGGVHLGEVQADYDRAREESLRSMGYAVVRFTNVEVLTDGGGVLRRLRAAIAGLLSARAKAKAPPAIPNHGTSTQPASL